MAPGHASAVVRSPAHGAKGALCQGLWPFGRCDSEGLLCPGCTADSKVHQLVKQDRPGHEAEVSGLGLPQRGWRVHRLRSAAED